MIPESQKENNDLVDLLTTSFQKVEDFETDDGKLDKRLVIDPKTAWWQLHNVASNTLGRLALELEQFERKSEEAKHHMCRERALVFGKQIQGIVDSYKYSIDAKSSESLSDKNNAIQTLTDKIKSNKIERRYVMKDEMKKSMWDGLVGKDRERDMEQG